MALAEGMVTWIHLICASIWVGGSIFLGIVLAPMLKTIIDTVDKRVALMVKIGRRFNSIALPSFIILVITGIYNSRGFIADPAEILSTQYGIILLIKVALVIATIATYAVHIRLLNARVEEKLASGKFAQQYVQTLRSRIIHLGRITVILSVGILFLASLLDSGTTF